MNDTILKFGYPATLVAEFDHWVVLLRPAQPTVGSLVLAARTDVHAFGDLPPDAFAELALVTPALEATLREAVGYDRLNYLMLMMVDPHPHFHIIPRYEGSRTLAGITIDDVHWPKPPALGEARALDSDEIGALAGELRRLWGPRR